MTLKHTPLVGILWTSDQPDAEVPDNTQHPTETEGHGLAGFEHTILASERPQIHALERLPIVIRRLKALL